MADSLSTDGLPSSHALCFAVKATAAGLLAVVLQADSKAAIAIVTGERGEQRKHIDVAICRMREMVVQRIFAVKTTLPTYSPNHWEKIVRQHCQRP